MTAVLGFVALLAYVAWLWPILDVYAGGSDSAGYLFSAQLFRRGRLEVPITYPPAVSGGLVNQPCQAAPAAPAPTKPAKGKP